ncbi:tRNA U-34 5-methylaminomethyl-2-thiouridine biosynthesis protein [Ectopseudomonas mendocina]|uniref:tRNA U-34 5-methylaminomethyl-2-thiouridine biosynthesis protein n=1 Tax=Ectopseudomonas mendocina TaxID=300 RepID=A0ABZ2RLG2_ECTME
MTIVSAFMLPGSPLPLLKPDAPNWQQHRRAIEQAGQQLKASQPDVVLIYSTQWFAVLDEIWLTRARSQDVHVDENWHEFGDMPYDIVSDVELAQACVARCKAQGINARGADYQGFPIDTGTIVATTLLGVGTEDIPVVVASNNLYDDAAATAKLAALAVECAAEQGKRVAVVGVGGLSGGLISRDMEAADDHFEKPEDDRLNRRVLELIKAGNQSALLSELPEYCQEAKADMGLKHLHFILGALEERYMGADVLHYGPIYGGGAATLAFKIGS